MATANEEIQEKAWEDLDSAAVVEDAEEEPTSVTEVSWKGDDVPHTKCISAKTVNEDPRMVHFEGFLSPEEAAHLLALAEGRWVRSTVTRGTPDSLLGAKAEEAKAKELAEKSESSTKPSEAKAEADADSEAESEANLDEPSKPAEVVSRGCTSWNVRLNYEESTVVERILARVATLTGFPLENVEQLVLVRYHEGEVFRLHHDGAMRPATVFAYLNDVKEGGETYFPYVGYKIHPAAGTAMMWFNTINGESGPDATSDRRMDHEALPPGPGCVKYAMNCFVNYQRQRDCSHIHIVQTQRQPAQAGA